MEKWFNTEFESSTKNTKQFNSFSRNFKTYLKKELPEDIKIINFTKGHFNISIFVKNETSGKFAYISVWDVRLGKCWSKNILYRTAKDEKDFTGGSNRYSKLEDLIKKISNITNE